eukprot:CAMPEP_0194085680 /NCGR_PEP_ID=MMETSP0149-20130528/18391_1 /TAXON_ID=122233 /ORGANISM="Chaetoceros debilis, Strain MM31A-1" /LENGTH=177 /DNA_ID=CAMNT_0038768619 /DNA_START=96 /DNA_END=629 /DNA_ORIENTATION=+
MARQYNRVSSDDRNKVADTNMRSPSSNSTTSTATSAANNNPANKSIGQRISDKIHAAVWVLFALFVAQYTDVPRVLLSDPRPVRPLLHAAIGQLAVNFILMLYLGLFLPHVKGIRDSQAWSIYCPRIIPIMTLNGIVCSFLLTRSLWPIWGFLTPFILGVEAMGLLFSMHFIPWFFN